MARPTNPQIDGRIAALHGQHKTEREIADILVREGFKITASGVHRALGRLGLAKGRDAAAQPGRQPGRRAPASPAAPPATDGAAEPADFEGSLRRSLGHLERTAKKAEETGDIKVVVAAARAITQLVPQLAKLTPPVVPSVDEKPDMVRAAKLGLEKMHAALDRLLKDPA